MLIQLPVPTTALVEIFCIVEETLHNVLAVKLLGGASEFKMLTTDPAPVEDKFNPLVSREKNNVRA